MPAATILVVDDDHRITDLVVRILKHEGYQVLHADGAHQALEHFQSGPFVHLVLSDMEMPGMSGMQLLREVHQISSKTSRVLMTGGGVNPAEMPDNVPVLEKPFSTPDLISVVRIALALSPNLEVKGTAAKQRSDSAASGFAPES